MSNDPFESLKKKLKKSHQEDVVVGFVILVIFIVVSCIILKF